MAQRYYNTSVRFRSEIQRLLEMVGLAQYQSEIQRIATQLLAAQSSDERYPAFRDLVVIDKTIPGLGLHNIDEKILHNREISIKYRAIFRGIQYVEMHIGSVSLEWLARDIVQESCYHVESSLKYRFNIEDRWSVGMILSRIRRGSLDNEMVEILWLLNKAVYNKAKHTVEHLDWDSHLFSVADAIAVYLVCRVIGARLLKDSDVTTTHGEPVF